MKKYSVTLLLTNPGGDPSPGVEVNVDAETFETFSGALVFFREQKKESEFKGYDEYRAFAPGTWFEVEEVEAVEEA